MLSVSGSMVCKVFIVFNSMNNSCKTESLHRRLDIIISPLYLRTLFSALWLKWELATISHLCLKKKLFSFLPFCSEWILGETNEKYLILSPEVKTRHYWAAKLSSGIELKKDTIWLLPSLGTLLYSVLWLCRTVFLKRSGSNSKTTPQGSDLNIIKLYHCNYHSKRQFYT